MSCDCPMLAVKGDLQPSGKYKYNIIGRYIPENLKRYPDGIAIPCGQCIGCRLDYAKSWADRMMLELDHSKKAVFVTCTYDEDNVHRVTDPETGETFMTLCKKDSAEFLKRLRNEYETGRIRFYCSGEYGTKTKRPHLHYILFGLNLDDCGQLEYFSQNKFACVNYKCPLFMKYWKKGNVIISNVTWETCAYVARYALKKLKGTDEGEREFIEKEFTTCSRRPGIGMYYIEDHPELFKYSNIPLPGTYTLKNEVKKLIVPKAFIKKLDDPGSEKNPNPFYDPELFSELKRLRKETAENAMFAKLSQTDYSFIDIKRMEEDNRKNSVRYLDVDTQYIV